MMMTISLDILIPALTAVGALGGLTLYSLHGRRLARETAKKIERRQTMSQPRLKARRSNA